MKKVNDISIGKNNALKDLMDQFSASGGFTSKKLADAAKMLKKMEDDAGTIKFLSFPADIISNKGRH